MDEITPGTEAPEFLFERVQELQGALEAQGDSSTREVAEELVSAIVQLYGEGLDRILTVLISSGGEGASLAARLTEDPLLSTLLLIHDLHPVPLTDRVQGALDSVRPYMESHGGNVELLSLEDGVARIHLQGSCSDCSASSVTLELAIKQALEEAAPDLAGLEVEGVAPQLTGLALPMSGDTLPMAVVGASEPDAGHLPRIELPIVNAGPGAAAPPAAAPAWIDLDSLGELDEGSMRAVSLGADALVVANVDGALLAYRDECAACGAPLRDGTLVAGSLACGGCGRSYFLPRAGRSLDADRLQLKPVPLLRDRGSVRVALVV